MLENTDRNVGKCQDHKVYWRTPTGMLESVRTIKHAGEHNTNRNALKAVPLTN